MTSHETVIDHKKKVDNYKKVSDHKRSLEHLPTCIPPRYTKPKQTTAQTWWWTEQDNWFKPHELIPSVYWKEYSTLSGNEMVRVSDRGGGGDCMFRVFADALNIRFNSIEFEFVDIREIIAAQVKTPQIAKWLIDVYMFTEKTVKNAFNDEMIWRPSSFERDSKLFEWSDVDQMNEMKNIIRTVGQTFWGDAFMLILLLDTQNCFIQYSIDCYVLAPSIEQKRLQILQIPTRNNQNPPREWVLFILFTGTHYELLGTVRQNPKNKNQTRIESILPRKDLLPIHKEWIRRSTISLDGAILPHPIESLFRLLK